MFKKDLRQRKLNRLRKFDYSSSGYYFVTIGIKNKEESLGKIINKKIMLNEIGESVNKIWLQIPKYYKNVLLDEFVIMPNHMHGIIIINKSFIKINHNGVGTGQCPVPTKTNIKYGLLSKIINGFKNATTKHIRKTLNNFQWQRSYYDHIIRNEKSLHEIRQYIKFNPIKWDEDKNNTENIFM